MQYCGILWGTETQFVRARKIYMAALRLHLPNQTENVGEDSRQEQPITRASFRLIAVRPQFTERREWRRSLGVIALPGSRPLWILRNPLARGALCRFLALPAQMISRLVAVVDQEVVSIHNRMVDANGFTRRC